MNHVKMRDGIVLVLGRHVAQTEAVGIRLAGGKRWIRSWLDGLHYEDVQERMDDFTGIIVTMSPTVIDRLVVESAEDLQSAIVLVDAQGEPRNLTAEEAWAMYRAYKVEIQHVSDILITSGVW